MSRNSIREFEITDDIRKVGYSGIYATGKTLVLKSTTTDSLIACPFYKDDIHKTVEGIKEALRGHSFDEQTITKLCTLFTQVWLASVEAEAETSSYRGASFNGPAHTTQR